MVRYGIKFWAKYLILPYTALWAVSNFVSWNILLCSVPLVSRSSLCSTTDYIHCHSGFDLLAEIQSRALRQLARNAEKGAWITASMSKPELASSKLSVLLGRTDFPATKGGSQRLMTFSDSLRKVARRLQLFNSEVGC